MFLNVVMREIRFIFTFALNSSMACLGVEMALVI